MAFRKDGLHAFGGYIEGFLPAKFDNEAVANDDRILSFLNIAGDTPVLGRSKDRYVLSRGDVEVRFEASSDVPLPEFPMGTESKQTKTLTDVDLKLVKALLDSVPKTGWGALNAEMLGIIVCDSGLVSTDNTSMGWAPSEAHNFRLVLPRPFCLALIEWTDNLGEDFKLIFGPTGILAKWNTGEKLYGSLPAANAAPIDFSVLCQELTEAAYAPQPDNLKAYLGEAAIFSEDLKLELKNKTLNLSTPGEISWHRQVLWAGDGSILTLNMPLKRIQTVIQYTDEIAFGDNRMYFRTQSQDLYIVISAKTVAG